MKKILGFLLLFSLLCPAWMFAESIDPAPGDASAPFEWWTYIIPLLTPLLVLGVKKLVPNIPNAALPVLATMGGVVLDLLNGLLTTATTHVGLGIVLGLASIGVREMLDQFRQAAAGTAGTPAKSAAFEAAVAAGKTMQ